MKHSLYFNFGETAEVKPAHTENDHIERDLLQTVHDLCASYFFVNIVILI